MKRLILALLLIAAPISISITGCNTSPIAIEYKTLSTVGASVDTAMKVGAKLRVAGKITAAQWDIIALKFAQEQAAYNLCIDIAVAIDGSKTNFPAPVELQNLATDLINLVNSFK